MTLVVLAALATSAGCISNMPQLKEALGYAKAPPPAPVYLPPVAKAAVNATSTMVGAPLRFTTEGTRDPQNLPLESSWSFGDGGAALGDVVTHSYQKAGEFTVRLLVMNAGGMTDQAVLTIHVDAVPVAAFTITPSSGARAGDKLAFDASGSSSTTGGALTYAWDFGDGSIASCDQAGCHYWPASGAGATSLDAKPTHAYAAPGLFLVKLRVGDASGATGEATQPVGVSGDVLRTTGHFDLAGADANAHPFTLAPGASGLVATLTFDRGAAGINDLSLTLKDAAGNVVQNATLAQGAQPDPMPGSVTLRVVVPGDALAKSAPGAWSAVVQRGSTMTPTGVDYAVEVAASY
jgi:PKD repeat protein